MIKKIKQCKIYCIIIGILAIIIKLIKFGEHRERNKQTKEIFNNIKKSKETDEIIDNASPSERAELL